MEAKRVSYTELRRKMEEEEESNNKEEEERDEGRRDSEIDEDVDRENRFTKWHQFVLVSLAVFYVADLCLDAWVAGRLFQQNNPKRMWFVIFCILLPNLYAGYKSLQWYLRAHDEEPIRDPSPWIIRVTFFPISLLLRYYDSLQYGRKSRQAWKRHDRRREDKFFNDFIVESAEASMLRLFIIFLEDAPIVVLNLSVVLLTNPEAQKHRLDMVIVVLVKILFTMTLGVVHYLSSTKAVYHAAMSGTTQSYSKGSQWTGASSNVPSDWKEKGILPWQAQICIYLWHLCSIASRLSMYSMFVVSYFGQLWILCSVRWVLHVIWIKWDVSDISLTNCVAYGGVYLFSFVPTSPQMQLVRICFYHLLSLFENITVAVLFSYKQEGSPYMGGAMGILFGGFFTGLLFMTLYYGLFHPSRKNTWFYRYYYSRRGSSRHRSHA